MSRDVDPDPVNRGELETEYAAVDTQAASAPDDICECGHTRRGHHRLCNGRVGKRTCMCREFTPRETR